VKYELDKRTGLLWLDRVLHSRALPGELRLPAADYCEDGDALDVLVLGRSRWCRSASCARARSAYDHADEKGQDDKSLPCTWTIRSTRTTRHCQLPPHR